MLSRSNILERLGYLCLVFLFLPDVNIDVGFHLKAYHVIGVLLFLLFLFNNGKIYKIKHHEILFLFFYMYFFSLSSFSYDIDSSLRLFFGFVLMFFVYFGLAYSLKEVNGLGFESFILKLGIFLNILYIALYVLYIWRYGFYGGPDQEMSVLGVYFERGLPRLTGYAKDPNIFNGLNAVFIFCGLYFISLWKGRLLLLLSLACTFLTLSFGGLLSILVGFLIYSLIQRRFLKLFVYASCVILFVYIIFYGFDFFDINKLIESRSNAAQSGSGRFETWSNGVVIFLDNILFGIGPFSFLKYNYNYFNDYHYMHNTFLEILVEGGIFSLLLFIIAWGAIFNTYIKANKFSYLKKLVSFYFPTTVSVFVIQMSTSGYLSESLFLSIFITYIFQQKVDKIRASSREGSTKNLQPEDQGLSIDARKNR